MIYHVVNKPKKVISAACFLWKPRWEALILTQEGPENKWTLSWLGKQSMVGKKDPEAERKVWVMTWETHPCLWGGGAGPPGRESWKVKSTLLSILTLAGRPGGALKSRFGGNRELRFNLYWGNGCWCGGGWRGGWPGDAAAFRLGVARQPGEFWGLQEGSQHCCLKTAVRRRGWGTKEMLCLSWVGLKVTTSCLPLLWLGLCLLQACSRSLSCSSFTLARVRGRNTAEGGALAITPAWHFQTAWLKTGWPESHRQSTQLGEDTHSDQEVENSE